MHRVGGACWDLSPRSLGRRHFCVKLVHAVYKAKEVSSGQTFAMKHIRLTPGEEVVNETMREGKQQRSYYL